MADPAGGASSDRELMARLAQGDREALTPLVERHYRRLYRVALGYLREREDALDVVQEAFVKVFDAARRWDGSADAGPWLSRVTVNLAIDRYRRNKRRGQTFSPLVEGDHVAALKDHGPGPERGVHHREASGRVERALRSLPERQRAVVVLRHYQDLSLEEIAQTLGMSLGTVKSSLHRALHRMRETLAGSAP
jgi:RNA polymerase sigma-70 factor (ECF subfamily)